jgi:hypothetical protein
VQILRAAADDYVLQRVGAEDLPMIAADALARGVDSPALRELAGLSRTDTRESADLLAHAMGELGHPLRERRVVLWDRARQAAAALINGALGAEVAAGEIAWLLCEAEHLDEHGARCDLATRFELLSVNWTDMPERRDEVERSILAAARELSDVA